MGTKIREAVIYYPSLGYLRLIIKGLLFGFLDRLLEMEVSLPRDWLLQMVGWPPVLVAAGCGSEFDFYV